MARLDDAAAVVTGASSGIGRAIARRFADEGAQVTVASRSPEPREGDTPTHELIREEGGDAQFVETNVRSTDDIRAALDATVDAYGSLDVAVNNAGQFIGMEPIGEVDEETFEDQIGVNVEGVYFSAKEAFERMREQDDGGSIINVSSLGGLRGLPNASLYSTAKGAVTNLTRELAVEAGPEGVRVNALAPGVVETAMTTEDEQIAGTMTDQIPLGRDGRPGEVADAAVFLASDDAAYVNGHNLVVDGGLGASV